MSKVQSGLRKWINLVRQTNMAWAVKQPPNHSIEPTGNLHRRPAEIADWNEAELIENPLTLFLMRIHGWQRVRSGYWGTVSEEATEKNLRHHGRLAESPHVWFTSDESHVAARWATRNPVGMQSWCLLPRPAGDRRR
jgi:hypothetical protein